MFICYKHVATSCLPKYMHMLKLALCWSTVLLHFNIYSVIMSKIVAVVVKAFGHLHPLGQAIIWRLSRIKTYQSGEGQKRRLHKSVTTLCTLWQRQWSIIVEKILTRDMENWTFLQNWWENKNENIQWK